MGNNHKPKFIELLTCAIGDWTVVRRRKIINEIIPTVHYVDIEKFPATIVQVQFVDTCLANHILPFLCGMTSVQPNWSASATLVLSHHVVWHFSSSKARKAIPSQWQITITQSNLSFVPWTFFAAARVIDFRVCHITATVIARWNLGHWGNKKTRIKDPSFSSESVVCSLRKVVLCLSRHELHGLKCIARVS